MNLPAIQKVEIIQELSLLPEHKLEGVQAYIQTILSEAKITKTNRSLRGIWKDKGFERISSIEIALKEARQELSDSLIKKKL